MLSPVRVALVRKAWWDRMRCRTWCVAQPDELTHDGVHIQSVAVHVVSMMCQLAVVEARDAQRVNQVTAEPDRE